MEALLAEAGQLADSGVKELIVIAQDITRYGMDLEEPSSLAQLLKELCKLDFHWIRLHYLYPEVITDEAHRHHRPGEEDRPLSGHPHPALQRRNPEGHAAAEHPGGAGGTSLPGCGVPSRIWWSAPR